LNPANDPTIQDAHFPSLTASQLPLGGSTNIALEILNGTDEQIDVQDIMGSSALGSGIGESSLSMRRRGIGLMQCSVAPAAGVDIHAAMERKHRM
jgi:proteasome maturation protein